MSYATSSDKTIADRLQDLREDSSESSLAPLDELLPSEDVPAFFAVAPEDISGGLVHLVSTLYYGTTKQTAYTINTDTNGVDNYGHVVKSGSNWKTKELKLQYDISLNSGGFLANEGEAFAVNLFSVPVFAGITYSSGSFSYDAPLDYTLSKLDVSVLSDGVVIPATVTCSDAPSTTNGLVDFKISVTTALESDVQVLSLVLSGTYLEFFPSMSLGSNNEGFAYGFYGTTFGYTLMNNPTNGLLKSIIGLITNIRDNVVGLVDAILSLPGLIWDYIESGLMALFIPDQDQMVDFNNAMDELLADRLGALYQGTNMVIDFLMSLGTYEQQSTIRFPGLDMSDFGIPFVMEPQEVEIIPDAFDFIVDSIKFIVNVLATILFVNSLKRRLEKVFEGD